MNGKSVYKVFLILFSLLFLFPSQAHAHLIGGNGFVSGMTHPLLGLDHLLAMVAVGIISTKIGNTSQWKIPGTFILFMIMGGALTVLNITLPFIETGIAMSVLLLGVAIVLSKKISLTVIIAYVGLFAVFHGYAHGEEMPTIAHPILYALGFVLSTAVLHTAGVFIGHYAKKSIFSFTMLRFSGAAISMAGIYFLLYR